MIASTARTRVGYWSRAFARLALIIVFVTYSAAKFTGAQFVVPGYLLDSPVADLSGMDLTWAFFSHSPLYSGFIAIGQLAAAALLAFERTVRLGAIVLLPITTNIVLVNIGYDIGQDTLVLSLVLLFFNLYLVACNFAALKECFWNQALSDAPRPRFMDHPAAIVTRVSGFAIIVVGIFWLFTGIMNGPAGGKKEIAGDWLVESASIDGRPVVDPALGESWLWISFDPSERFSVRTTRGTFMGKYTVDATTSEFTARYDPVPLPPVYPGQKHSSIKISDADEMRILGEQLEGFKWPIELYGNFSKDGDKLIVSTQGRAGRVEWVLVPYKRPKF